MDKSQRVDTSKHVVAASYLGWMLDAFDFFIMVFLLQDIAKEFGTDITQVTIAITLTLAMRPVGALLFGRLADRFGRKPVLMLDVGLFALFEVLTAFSPNFTAFIILRALFGIAMGGEWGIGSALTMESISTRARGLVSGILQAGYPSGYLLASVAYALLYSSIGWRGMFIVGGLPALLVLYIRSHVPESPAWEAASTQVKPSLLSSLKQHWKLALFTIVLMTGFNFFSHGSQDLYPTFLQVQHGFNPHTVGTIAIIYNIGAIIGGISFGALSDYIGRRYAILLATLLALPVLPLWAFSATPVMLALGAFLMQFAVQGAWGVIPCYLNELSPAEIRATFPGLMYQLGNLLASANATLQAMIAAHYNGDYSYGLMLVVGSVAILIAGLMLAGPEQHGRKITGMDS